MDSLTPREKQVVAAITRFARDNGRWPTIREIGKVIAVAEGKGKISVASTFRSLVRKGVIACTAGGQGYCIVNMRIKRSVKLIKG